MFRNVEHKFRSVEHKFKNVEYMFNVVEHNFLLGIEIMIVVRFLACVHFS